MWVYKIECKRKNRNVKYTGYIDNEHAIQYNAKNTIIYSVVCKNIYTGEAQRISSITFQVRYLLDVQVHEWCKVGQYVGLPCHEGADGRREAPQCVNVHWGQERPSISLSGRGKVNPQQ